MQKRLLCIAPDDPAIPMFTCGAMPDWEIVSVSGLGDASRAMRDNRFPVGLMLRVRSLQRTSDLDGFLRRHRATQWVGTVAPLDLDNAACRDLIGEHLHDFHTEPIDPARLAHTLGHAHGWAVLRRGPLDAGTAGGDASAPMLVMCTVP